MSSIPNPMLVKREPPLDRSWQRFVAVLCFIEFHCRFVCHGTELWHGLVGFEGSRELWGEWYTVTGSALFLVRALFLYLCGRALWTDRGNVHRWVWCVAVMSVAEIIASTAGTIAGESAYAYRTFTWPPAVTPTQGITTIQAAANNIEHLPWLALLLSLMWGRRWWAARFHIHVGRWLLPATVWIFWWLYQCLPDFGGYSPNDLKFSIPYTGYLVVPVLMGRV